MKRRKTTLAVIVISVLGVLLVYKLQMRQAERDAQQVRILNARYASIQYQNGSIIMIPSKRSLQYANLQPLSLKAGDKFGANDRHWASTYTIKKIQSDGALVNYCYSGAAPAYQGDWCGSFKLNWK